MLQTPGAYLHFPWCIRKCPYCDFNSHPLRADTGASDPDDAKERLFLGYVDALCEDIRGQDFGNIEFASVFLGGGTPSLFAPDHIHKALNALSLSDDAEITMEANPGTTEYADFGAYKAAGVNRLSMGAQSFNDEHLSRLGRIHSAIETTHAFDLARRGGIENINLDLMWGLPQQNVEQALADLETAISLNPEHISWYQLTIEPKTEFAHRTPILPVDDTLASIEREGLARLADAGYERYEVSAYAKTHRAGGPDLRCRHNLNYWRFGDYAGFGAGAHGKLTHFEEQDTLIARTSKASQPRLYQQTPTDTVHTPIEREARSVEFMMNALRLVHGTSFAEYESHTGLDWQDVSGIWRGLVADGLVHADRCATTPLGLRYLDSVLQRFL